MNLRRRRYIVFLSLCIVTRYAIPTGSGGELMQESEARQIARKVARAYIIAVKRWQDDEFDIQILEEREGNVVVLDAIHAGDLTGKGVNKSVQLYIDVVKNVVVKELSYQ